MKVFFTKRIPFGRFRAISLFGFMFYKAKDERHKLYMEEYPTLYYRLVQHERTHFEQQKEMLFVFFFIWYALEWAIKCFFYRDAYRNLSFEREARENEKELDSYEVIPTHNKRGGIKTIKFVQKEEKGSLIKRSHFAWLKYI